MSLRIGHGYDVHAVTEGDHVMLGGVRIDAPFAIEAHSDGDVLLHALCDALLGAAGLGDIGRHFPDSEPAWKDAPGQTLLRRTVGMLRDRRWKAVNADLTLLAERPRIRPHVDAMRELIAAELDIDRRAVNVKATTHEGIGTIGRGEGLAACAVVLLEAR